jgi:adsorption protein B
VEILAAAFAWLDPLVAWAAWPVVIWLAASGLDDLLILGLFLAGVGKSLNPQPGPVRPRQRPIAIFVACWREHAVIARMIEHNSAAIRYQNYTFFVGAYPNDADTVGEIRRVAETNPRVRIALCPRTGPTSKSDCLNSIYRVMLEHERQTGERFELIVIHDAEDLIHPESLSRFHQLAGRYAMIQTPVLALPTPMREWTHGIYCDEFARTHTVDIAVRCRLGGFVPSAGVGTAFRRDVIDQMANGASGLLFEPASLTEDYESGLRVYRLGLPQKFEPVDRGLPGMLATREYFPRSLRAAIRQRTRWITGISLQAWKRHGWGRRGETYWFWRDRKALIGCPANLAADIVCAYGLLSWAVSSWCGTVWLLGELLPATLVAGNLSAGLILLGSRFICTSRVYGLPFALGIPVRLVLGDLVNTIATGRAVWQFWRASATRRSLAWSKTDHAYPEVSTLSLHRPALEEILVDERLMTADQLRLARATCPPHRTMADHLIALDLVPAEAILAAASRQSGLAVRYYRLEEVSRAVARALPVSLSVGRRLLPVAIREGTIELACARVPDDTVRKSVERVTRLRPIFTLVGGKHWGELASRLL